MLSGWFDAFRSEGGPTLYNEANRTAAVDDVRSVLIYISFSTLFLAFLIVFPGIRKEKISTLVCVTLSLFVGAVILVANFGSGWQTGAALISSPYRAFSKERLHARLGVHLGLDSVNVTLQATAVHRHSEEINYNERFYWAGATQMKDEYRKGLVKGLPFPILTVAEYLSQDREGFCWGRRYRLAGYYTCILLWTAFGLWLLMNVLLCTVPRYGAYAMQLTGCAMLLSNALYAVLQPRRPLLVPFEQGTVSFHYGWCFWLVLGAGVSCVVVGALVAVLDTLWPHKFSTILEVDYDTPYRYFVQGNDILRSSESGLMLDQASGNTSSAASTVSPGGVGSGGASDSGGMENGAFQKDEEDDEVTFVDGKVAVSLQNFGRYANARRHSSIFAARPTAFTENDDVRVDLQAAALW